jgi:glycerophosphoryl diester phosphodiesterase
MLKFLSKPAIFAHRGASAYAPENTIVAFELAIRQKADAIELDAKLTKDGKVVIFHDQTLERTTGAKGRVIDYPLADLRRLDAGSHFDVAYRGEPIPTLDEVFDAFGSLTYFNIEITNYATPTDNLPQHVVQIVQSHRVVDRVLFSSFNPVALLRIRRLLPEAPIGLLATTGIGGVLARSWLGTLFHYDSLHPAYPNVHRKLVEKIHRNGHKVLVYKVNKPDDMRRLFELGVDGIMTDDPLTARHIISTSNLRRLKDLER